jgi:hypothetical protein
MRTILLLFAVAHAAQGAPKPVPPSPYLPVVYRYADMMLKHGRNSGGLFLSILDRSNLSPVNNRPLAKSRHDQNLLRVLYTLSELSGKPVYRDAADGHLKKLLADRLAPWEGSNRVWMLWERCFDLAPEASKALVTNLGETRSPSRAGFAIRALAVGRQLKSIEEILSGLEKAGDDSPAELLSAAIDCDGAAHRVPEAMAARLRAYAARNDQAFCTLRHDLKGRGGFAISDGEMTPLWETREGRRTTALLAMMCVSRYENGGSIAYRDMIHAAADAYRNAPPPDGADVWPMTFGHAISLQLAAWRSTSNEQYLDAAKKLADLALQRYWADGPLPRATSKDAHYDSSTGADTLALALIELHLGILHITAVRCPPNTIDR